MKKVRIFTYKQSNYGAILQAYALQTYLKNKFNADVKIVDFTTKDHLKSDSLLHTSDNILYNIIITTCNFIRAIDLKQRRRRTEEFKSKYLTLTERYTNMKDLILSPIEADIYLTGSDQVFNPNSKYRQLYYLGFNKGMSIKVAYAASFGISKFTVKTTQIIKPFLDDFDHISCRESIGANYLSDIIGKEIPCLVDPTLLLDRKEWEKISVAPSFKKKYILVYEINGGDSIIKLAKKIGSQKGLPIVCITQKTYKIYGVNKQVYNAGPSEFLGWFNNAEYIVTDSFHGTVFSWMFHKQFFYYLAYEKTSSRVRTLLKHIHCENRLIEYDSIHNFDCDSYSDYEVTDMEVINESKTFINNFMTAKNE